MPNSLVIKKKIKSFNNIIQVSGDKSLSIRWVLFSSLGSGISTSKNLLMSDDVIASIKAVRKLGIKVIVKKNVCKIFGKGINGYKYKKNIIINAQNSGTLGRLILGAIIDTPYPIKIIGDNSLSKRDFKRIADPLTKFGAKFKLKDNSTLPLIIKGSTKLKSINFLEKKGSAQCKSAVIFGALKSNGETTIKAKKSRNHTELLCKYLNIPIKVYSKNNYDYIKIKKISKIDKLNYNIPADISSSAFFMVLTALSENSKLTLKNVNINPTRTGIISILKKMGVNIKIKNKKLYKGEINADIKVERLLSVIDIVHISQVYIIYLSSLKGSSFSPGPESLDVKLFKEEEIPWNDLAFESIKETLRFYFKNFPLRDEGKKEEKNLILRMTIDQKL